jgi:hypothetical protein
LVAERERFERLQRGERAVWLTERLGECVREGTIVPVSELHKIDREVSLDVDVGGRGVLVRHGDRERRRRRGEQRRHWSAGALDHDDPLGLLGLRGQVRDGVWTALRVVSSLGIVGALAFWVARYSRGEGEALGSGFDLGGLGRLVGDW